MVEIRTQLTRAAQGEELKQRLELGAPTKIPTLSGTALLWGIPFERRHELAEALESDSIPDEWVQASRRRYKEAAAHAGISSADLRTDDELFATLEYLARKDYGGRLEIWQDGSIHLVREEPDAMHFDLPYSDDIPNN